MFRQRALSAIIGLPVLCGLIILDGFAWARGLPLLAVIAAASMVGTEELRRMLQRRNFSPPKDMGLMMGALPSLFLYFYRYDYDDVVLAALSLVIVIDVLMLALALIGDITRRMSPRRQEAAGAAADDPADSDAPEPAPTGGTLGALRDFALLGLGGLYIGGLMSYLILLRRADAAVIPPWGVWPVALIIAAVWIADTAAFAAGKLLNGPKLWPRVSPGKTVIGTAAGVVAAALVMLIAAAAGVFGEAFDVTLARAGLIGLVIGVAGLGGDLLESAFKRWVGVKDSGAILPGHGGILDRCDSLLWAAPVFFYLLIALRAQAPW